MDVGVFSYTLDIMESYNNCEEANYNFHLSSVQGMNVSCSKDRLFELYHFKVSKEFYFAHSIIHLNIFPQSELLTETN